MTLSTRLTWETEYLASASQSDADAYNAKTPEEKDAFYQTSVFNLLMEDLNANGTSEYLFDEFGTLNGIKSSGTTYAIEFTGNFQTMLNPDSGQQEVIGGNVHSGKLYKDGYVISDGTNAFDLEATFFGGILDAFGAFDDVHDDTDDTDTSGGGNTTGPASVDVQSDKIIITFDDANISENDMTKVSLNGNPVDLNASNVTFTASYMDGAEKFAETDYTHPTTPPPNTGPAITGAVYNNGVLEISLGDANATDAVAAKIFIGGSALDINSNDVNFVAADTGNNTPAKVTVGGLNWTSSTSNTDVIYDDDANTTTTDDQQTVTVNVGSSTTPPPAITGAVYNNGVLEISLGDVNATDAVAAKIFIGGSALDINSNDVNFVAADTGNNTPAKVTVGGLNWISSTSNTDVIYDDDANTTTTDDQQTVTVNVGSSTTPPPAITGAVYNNGVLEIQPW